MDTTSVILHVNSVIKTVISAATTHFATYVLRDIQQTSQVDYAVLLFQIVSTFPTPHFVTSVHLVTSKVLTLSVSPARLSTVRLVFLNLLTVQPVFVSSVLTGTISWIKYAISVNYLVSLALLTACVFPALKDTNYSSELVNLVRWVVTLVITQ